MRSGPVLVGMACVIGALTVTGCDNGDPVSRDLARQVGARRCSLSPAIGSFVPAMYLCTMPTGRTRCYEYNGAKFVRASCTVSLFPPEKKKRKASAGG
jgi:hypothetical protein